MAVFNLPPPPTSNNPKDPSYKDWFYKLKNYLSNIYFVALNFTGSNLTSIETRNHNDLQNIQGGQSGQYYHLTEAEYTQLHRPSTPPIFVSEESYSEETTVILGNTSNTTPSTTDMSDIYAFAAAHG